MSQIKVTLKKPFSAFGLGDVYLRPEVPALVDAEDFEKRFHTPVIEGMLEAGELVIEPADAPPPAAASTVGGAGTGE